MRQPDASASRREERPRAAASANPRADLPAGAHRALAAAADAMTRLRTELLAAIAPPACAACRAPLRDAGGLLCAPCRGALPWLRGPRCGRCGLPAPCGARCPARGAAYAAAWAPLAHEGPARALVAALKFRGALPVAELMAAQIAAGAPRELLVGATLVPVPLHPARRRGRGFDQAALIARALAQRTGLPLAPCLRRQGAATRQLGADRAQRLAAGRTLAIAVHGARASAAVHAADAAAPDLVPARALLVDDVHTTGATFDACARALRAAGAEQVVAVAYARALRW